MSEEYCDGVKILLKRMESNPEEFTQSNKWDHVVPKEAGGFSNWSHALSPEEEQALRDGVRKIARVTFTNVVMRSLLEDKEEKIAVGGGGISVNSGWNDPRMLAQNAYNPYQNAIQPGSWQEVATQTSNTSIVKVLKNKLGIK